MKTKEEIKAQRAAHYAANSKKENARCAAWKAANPEKVRAESKAYRASNPEKVKAAEAAWRAVNTEKLGAYQAAYRAANPEKIRARRASSSEKLKVFRRMRRYGVSPEAFQLMLLLQKSACGICKEPFLEKAPHVDHCHKTGEVRGLLCRRCNVALGLFKDSPELLRGALEYLEHGPKDRI